MPLSSPSHMISPDGRAGRLPLETSEWSTSLRAAPSIAERFLGARPPPPPAAAEPAADASYAELAERRKALLAGVGRRGGGGGGGWRSTPRRRRPPWQNPSSPAAAADEPAPGEQRWPQPEQPLAASQLFGAGDEDEERAVGGGLPAFATPPRGPAPARTQRARTPSRSLQTLQQLALSQRRDSVEGFARALFAVTSMAAAERERSDAQRLRDGGGGGGGEGGSEGGSDCFDSASDGELPAAELRRLSGEIERAGGALYLPDQDVIGGVGTGGGAGFGFGDLDGAEELAYQLASEVRQERQQGHGRILTAREMHERDRREREVAAGSGGAASADDGQQQEDNDEEEAQIECEDEDEDEEQDEEDEEDAEQWDGGESLLTPTLLARLSPSRAASARDQPIASEAGPSPTPLVAVLASRAAARAAAPQRASEAVRAQRLKRLEQLLRSTESGAVRGTNTSSASSASMLSAAAAAAARSQKWSGLVSSPGGSIRRGPGADRSPPGRQLPAVRRDLELERKQAQDQHEQHEQHEQHKQHHDQKLEQPQRVLQYEQHGHAQQHEQQEQPTRDGGPSDALQELHEFWAEQAAEEGAAAGSGGGFEEVESYWLLNA